MLPNFLKKKYTCKGKTEEEIRRDLYEACREGKVDWVTVIVREPEFDVNKIIEEEHLCQGLSPMHITTRYNRQECLKILIEHNGNVDIEDRFGFRPIHDAALYGHTECIQDLLAHGASTKGAYGSEVEHLTPLFYAIQQNHKECVNLLNEKIPSNDVLIWDLASKRGNASMTSLAAKENIVNKSLTNWLKNSALTGHANYLDKVKRTFGRKFGSREALNSIHTAAQHGRTDYIKKLLEQGVDVNTKNKELMTPLHYAARYGHEESIKLLLDSGADINARTDKNYTPFHVALRQGCFEGISKLLECGQNVNEIGGGENETPVHMCLTLGVEDDILKEILKYNPNFTIANKSGKLPTQIKCDYEDLTKLVSEYVRN